MASTTLTLQNFLGRFNVTQLAAPVLILMILAMMVLPLPAFILDVLFTFNIALSILVLLVAVNTRKTLDFSVFPTVLLLTTLLRLSLNVASTRIVMLEAHRSRRCGKGDRSLRPLFWWGNFAVGIVVFLILVVINFVVITKGCRAEWPKSRPASPLDAMPGKQMAIDADLNAGLIAEEEARRRRDIAREAEFFGPWTVPPNSFGATPSPAS